VGIGSVLGHDVLRVTTTITDFLNEAFRSLLLRQLVQRDMCPSATKFEPRSLR